MLGVSAQQFDQAKTVIENCRTLLEEIRSSVEKAAGVSEHDESTASKVKRLWQRVKWDGKVIEDFRSRISSNVSMLNSIISQQTQQNIVVVRDGVAKLVDRKETHHRMEILNWIAESDYSARQADLLDHRAPGTRPQLLDSVEFRAWVDTPGGVLFCTGIPGAGKTMATAIVTDLLEAQYGDKASIVQIYCNYQEPQTQSTF